MSYIPYDVLVDLLNEGAITEEEMQMQLDEQGKDSIGDKYFNSKGERFNLIQRIKLKFKKP